MSNKAPAWFNDFKNEFNNFKNEMLDFKSNQEQFNKEVISRLDNLEKDVHAIKNCPTIKAELQQTN